MAENFPGPWGLDIHYNSMGFPHRQQLNLRVDGIPDPGDDMSTILFLRRDNTTTPAVSAITAWINLLQPFYNTTTGDFVRADLWKYEPSSYAKTFVTSHTIGLPGTSATAGVQAAEVYITFRTQAGGILKLALEEPSIAPGIATTPPYTGIYLTLTNFILSPANWIYARDNSYPIANSKVLPGQNEAVFKKRFRPS